jgi:hypothetical protein
MCGSAFNWKMVFFSCAKLFEHATTAQPLTAVIETFSLRLDY